TTFGLLLERNTAPVNAALAAVAIGPLVGLIHGLLATKLRLQPFLITLSGLFIYRGLARYISHGAVGLNPQGSPEFRASAGQLDQNLVKGQLLYVPNLMLVMLLIAAVLAVLLHKSVAGRYFYAIGANEQAASYSGIAVDRYKILAYIICSTLAALSG